MIVKRVESPASYCRGDYEPQEYDPPENFGGADEIIYWYSVGDYCGAGEALLRKGDKWAHITMSHCSCNGPWDDEVLDREYQDPPFEVTEDYMKDLEVFARPDLFRVVKKK